MVAYKSFSMISWWLNVSIKDRQHSAGADVLTNKAVTEATLDISGRRFRVNLVVMPGLILDIIIGMNKMTD